MRYQLHGIPNGPEGVAETLRLMSLIVNKYKKSPVVRELALRLVGRQPQKNWVKEADAVHCFVRDRIRYVKDVRGVETLQTPEQTLRLGQGDCDDKSMLSAALLEAIGHKTRFAAVGMVPGHYSHVFTQVFLNGQWVTMDGTEPWPLGKNPVNVRAVMTQDN